MKAVRRGLSPLPSLTGRRRLLALFTGLILLLATVAAVLLLGLAQYDRYRQAIASPPIPSDPGEVLLVFDRPGLAVLLEAKIQPHMHARQTSIDYIISIEGSGGLKATGFAVVTSGGAQASEEEFWIGGPRTQKNGCWFNVAVIPEATSRCEKIPSERDDGPFTRAGARNGGQAILGTIQRDGGSMFTQVTAPTVSTFFSESGKRKYFQLPNIGTKYLPETMRDLPLDFGLGKKMFVPRKLDVIVEYGKTSPAERVESIAPEPYKAGQLAWIDIDASTVGPYGSIVDTALEDRAQRDLFLVGVVAGFAASAVPLLSTALWKVGRSILIHIRSRRLPVNRSLPISSRTAGLARRNVAGRDYSLRNSPYS